MQGKAVSQEMCNCYCYCITHHNQVQIGNCAYISMWPIVNTFMKHVLLQSQIRGGWKEVISGPNFAESANFCTLLRVYKSSLTQRTFGPLITSFQPPLESN